MGFSKIFETPKGKQIYHKKTICEAHRDLYDLLITHLAIDNQKLLVKLIPVLEEAYLMGIKMNKKLVEHKLGEAVFGMNDVLSKSKMRNERIKLTKILEENNAILSEFDR